MSARTAARRRRQAKIGYAHMARIGRGNNNRPIYHIKSIGKLTRREATYRLRLKLFMARKKGKEPSK
jgi:hypothetical protein